MLDNIKENEKYTLLIENNMGYVVSRQVRIAKAYKKDYAQYSDALHLHYKEKGKRKASGRVFTDNRIAIIEGWEDIKGTFEDEFVSFQNGKFDEIIEDNKLEPIFIQ